MAIGAASIPACRAGVPTKVLPDHDALICDPAPSIQSHHLLVAVAAQNYGQNSYRIRQPFDFAGRTGRISFDAEAYLISSGLGWVSVEVVEDPVNAPSFSVGADYKNDEGSLIPRNGFEVQFMNTCAGYYEPSVVGLRMVAVFDNYQETNLSPASPTCVKTQAGHLNRFEVQVSRNRISVYATPASADGVNFAPAQLLYSADVNLPFSRGYVSITTHNHATSKYSQSDAGRFIDAWTARWDNVGFDGPVIGGWREYEVADSLLAGRTAQNERTVSVGYSIADASSGPAQQLVLRGVDLANVTSARLSLSALYTPLGQHPIAGYTIRYRFNAKAWRDRVLTAAEVAMLQAPNLQGVLGHFLDIELSDLVQGDNTLEFVTVNVDHQYPPVFANIDLILKTQ